MLLATYNGGKWVGSQVESIKAQQGVDVSLIVSDDSSSDYTVAIVSALLGPRDKLLPKGPRMGSAARNFFRLLRQIDPRDYDYVALADQDDIWVEDKLARGIAALISRQADGYSSSIEALWPNGTRTVIRKDFPQKRWDHLFESPGPGCSFILNQALAVALCAALRVEQRSREETIGDCHDWFIYAFARANGYRWFIDSYCGLHYRQHATNAMGAHIGLRASWARWHRLRGEWYRDRVLTVAEMCGIETAWPIVRMARFSFRDRVLLALSAFNFRRRFRDGLILSIALILPGWRRVQSVS